MAILTAMSGAPASTGQAHYRVVVLVYKDGVGVVSQRGASYHVVPHTKYVLEGLIPRQSWLSLIPSQRCNKTARALLPQSKHTAGTEQSTQQAYTLQR